MPQVQKNSGTNNGVTNITPTLGSATTAGNTILIFVSSAGTLSTPSGFTSRSPQVNIQGCYCFEKLVASGNSTDTPTMAQGGTFNATWFIAEYSGITAFKTSNGSNASGQAAGSYATPALTPTSGATLIVAYMGVSGSASTTTFGAGQPNTWTNSFTGEQSVTQTGSVGSGHDSLIGGWASFQVTANGSTAYSTAASYTLPSGGTGAPHRIIAAYAHTAGGGTVFNDSVTEALTATDSESVIATFVAADTEAGTATDSNSAVATFAAADTETVSAGDADSASAVFAASDTETATATDADGGGYAVAQPEAASATETETAGATYPVSASEAGSASDTEAATAVFAASDSESANASDADAGAAAYPVAASESGTAADGSDGTLGNQSYSVSVAEAASASDNSDASLPADLSDSHDGGSSKYYKYWKGLHDKEDDRRRRREEAEREARQPKTVKPDPIASKPIVEKLRIDYAMVTEKLNARAAEAKAQTEWPARRRRQEQEVLMLLENEEQEFLQVLAVVAKALEDQT